MTGGIIFCCCCYYYLLLVGRTCPNNDHIKEMKLYLPISVRTSLEKMEDLDNQLSVVILRLPFEEEDKVKRLHRIGKD